MATIDEINILDYRPPSSKQILEAGRQQTVEPVLPTPLKDFFMYDVLNPSGRKLFSTIAEEVTNPLNFMAGAGVISKGSKGINALAKLKDEGFDVANPLFHGTKESFETFDTSKIGRRDKGFYGKGFYFTNNKKEAELYGPNVGEYYVKGKILNLGDYSELDRVYGKGGNYSDPLEDYKLWAGKLNKVNALPPVQKNAYENLLKAEKYFEENLQMIPTGKVTSGPAKGQTIYQGKIKDPDYDNDILVDDIFDKSELKEIFLIEAESSYKFRGLKDMEKNLSRFVRDLDQKESYEGIDDVSEFISDRVKKAGYSGINSGSETVIFNPKDILRVNK
jgi:hypothetical protein